MWRALRYTELNPVRAGLIAEADAWVWSSAAAHCGVAAADARLAMEEWTAQWNASTWSEYLRAGATESEIETFRQCTHTGRPLGTEEFVDELEQRTKRRLAPRKGGRPAKQQEDTRQGVFTFEL